jgi:hypothetical protein
MRQRKVGDVTITCIIESERPDWNMTSSGDYLKRLA